MFYALDRIALFHCFSRELFSYEIRKRLERSDSRPLSSSRAFNQEPGRTASERGTALVPKNGVPIFVPSPVLFVPPIFVPNSP